MAKFKRFLVLLLAVILIFISGITGYHYGQKHPNGAAMIQDGLSSEKPNPEKIQRLNQIIEENFLFDYNEEDLNVGLYKGMFEALGDPYTEYMTKAEYDSLEETMSGEFEGIGVVISPDQEFIKVVSPIDDTPAQRAGIKSGDFILAVDGEVFGASEYQEASKRMRGMKGTEVTLTIRRYTEDSFEDFDVTLVRDTIPVYTVSYSIMDNNIGYLRISSFDEPTSEEFKDAMEDLKGQGIQGLVLDLRSNPGGLVSSGTEIADMLLPSGPIVFQRDKHGNESSIKSGKQLYDTPMVVLVDGGTASSSEILTGALVDYKRATVVGTDTFGKGIIQRFWPLNDGSGDGVKITVAEFFTPESKNP